MHRMIFLLWFLCSEKLSIYLIRHSYLAQCGSAAHLSVPNSNELRVLRISCLLICLWSVNLDLSRDCAAFHYSKSKSWRRAIKLLTVLRLCFLLVPSLWHEIFIARYNKQNGFKTILKLCYLLRLWKNKKNRRRRAMRRLIKLSMIWHQNQTVPQLRSRIDSKFVQS